MPRFCRWLLVGLVCLRAEAFELSFPTDNDALLRGDKEAFYQPTVGGDVESGMFGCVRHGRVGLRLHEGIDIRCLRRDKRGEPLDEVRAAADGAVAFFNTKPGLSNYGRYVVLAHRWDGVEAYTLYAHLADIAAGLKLEQPVAKGQRLGTMGHSSSDRIRSEQAHLHFEVDVMMNTHFDPWYRKQDPKAPPFGNFNGQNLFGLDPSEILRLAADGKKKPNFAEYVARLPVGFTVVVPARTVSWIERHPEQVQRPKDNKAAVVAYEVGATAWGVPVAVWPRAANELTEAQQRALERRLPVVARVNAAALEQNGCRGLVRQGKHGWELSEHGREWCALLMFAP